MTIQHVSPGTSARAAAAQASPGADQDALVMQIHERLLQDLDVRQLEQLPDEDEKRSRVKAAAEAVLAEMAPGVAGVTREEVISAVVNDTIGFGPLDPLLKNPEITEIMINGPNLVFTEENGRLALSSVRFRDVGHIRRVADRIVQPLGRRLDESSPMVDARLLDGSRVNITIPPVSPKSPTITIRKFQTDRFGFPDYLRLGVLTEQVAGFLRAAVIAKANIVISGGTGSGKTTMLNALSAFIPDGERIVTIEDPIEIQLRQQYVISLEARPPGVGGVGEVTQGDLVKNALRMRPDRIVMGECRRQEAFDMLQAMNTGHDGSLTTLHANSPVDAIARIENMVMMAGFDLPVIAIRQQIASAINIIIQLNRLQNGSRRVTYITEIVGMEGDIVTRQDIFLFDNRGPDDDGRIQGDMVPTGIRASFADRFAQFGVSEQWTPEPEGGPGSPSLG